VRHAGSAFGDGRARTDRGTGTDAQRRDQHRSRADERSIADLRTPFVGAVVVAGDGARTDVHLAADVRIPHVGEVIGLAARSEVAVLHLDEVADVHAGIEG